MADNYVEQEIDGVFLGALVTVQCASCGTTIEAKIENPEPAETEKVGDYTIECATCSAALGRKAVIPFAPLIGEQVAELAFEDEEVEALPVGESWRGDRRERNPTT